MHWPSTLALLFIDLFSLKECTVTDIKAWSNMTHSKSKNLAKLLVMIDENTCSTDLETNVWFVWFFHPKYYILFILSIFLELSEIWRPVSHASRRILLSNHIVDIHWPLLVAMVQANVLLLTIVAQIRLEDFVIRYLNKKNSTYYLIKILKCLI